MQYRCKSISV